MTSNLQLLSRTIFTLVLYLLPAAVEAAPDLATISPGTSSAAANLPPDTVLEQGKALYDSGQYMAALDKFMKVLRRDPQQVEARQYVKMVVDQMRARAPQTPAQVPELAEPAPVPAAPAAPVPAPPVAVLDEEVRQRVEKRQLLTLDLAAIPGLKVKVDNKRAQVEIETSLLFADKTGGLREQGIPILDRVAAWLKTFGQQPVVIHCYPEELEDTNTNGSLFLHRYAQLYGFFVDEKKVSAARFVNAEVLKSKPGKADRSSLPKDVASSSNAARIVIASLGGGALPSQDLSSVPGSKWLEFSVLASRKQFNPEEGDWTDIDLAALTRKGIKVWYFRIVPAANKSATLFSLEGRGNLLRRFSWDGREEKSGSFVSAGNYIGRLTATDSDGTTKTEELTLKINRSTKSPSQASPRPKPVAVPKATAKPLPKPVVPAAPKPPIIRGDLPKAAPAVVEKATEQEAPKLAAIPDVPKPIAEPPKAEPPVAAEPAPAAEPPPAEEQAAEEPAPETDDQAIWKQVIQFDTNETDLKPTLKASLERIGKTLEVYPLQKVRIMGFADRSESNATQLARQRAEMIRNTLVNEYQVDAKRVIIAGGKVGSGAQKQAFSKAEISITN